MSETQILASYVVNGRLADVPSPVLREARRSLVNFMPGMDGYEVARRIRATPSGNGVQLIALTGWGQQEDVRRCFEAGFNHHLVKPLDLSKLWGLIARPPAGQAQA